MTQITDHTNNMLHGIRIDPSRDQLLTHFGKKTLENQYLQKGETYQGLFARVAKAFGDNLDHSQRLYDYMSQLWFMPATPILANGGTARGLPISCFLNEAQDELSSIINLWTENAWLSSRGGGIGSYWGNVRSISEKLSNNGSAVGIMPLIKVMESISLAIDQGSLRRGAAATYLPISHPEIKEFMEMRKPTGGDHNRKSMYLHHGVVINDEFMRCVFEDRKWNLTSPKDGRIIDTVPARELWIRLLTMRMETGEPYILYIDHINKAVPAHHKTQNLHIKTSNLCSEITLPTGIDQHGNERTAVCCLSSVNLENFKTWQSEPGFIEDIMRFLDNVLSDFIANAPSSMKKAIYSASQERSVGLGVMGFHAFLQKENIAIEDAQARQWNQTIFEHIQKHTQRASTQLAAERGACPDARLANVQERFSYKTAIAPTASISIICGGTSPGIEPMVSNAYTHKTLSGSFFVRNPFLKKCLEKKGLSEEELSDLWSSIVQKGTVQHLDVLSDQEKKVFKTAFEVDQNVLVELAAQRQPYICQSQSLNLFFDSNVEKKTLHNVHANAWKKGVKSLYYLRSRSIQRAESSSLAQESIQKQEQNTADKLPLQYEECQMCQ